MPGRPKVPRVPQAAHGVLRELGTLAASILLALEQSPRTAREIVDDLGLDPDAVQYALRRLRTCGAIAVVDSRQDLREAGLQRVRNDARRLGQDPGINRCARRAESSALGRAAVLAREARENRP